MSPLRGRDPKPLKKQAKPARPTKGRDREDIERAESEGMGQPQHTAKKQPAKKAAAKRKK